METFGCPNAKFDPQTVFGPRKPWNEVVVGTRVEAMT